MPLLAIAGIWSNPHLKSAKIIVYGEKNVFGIPF